MTQCKFDGCDRPARQAGWCATHYAQWYRTGDVWEIGNSPRKGRKICEFPGCEKFNFARGLCSGHARQSRLGQGLRPLKQLRPDDTETDRWCSTCKQWKPLDLYTSEVHGRLPRTCNPCRAEQMAIYNAKPSRRTYVRWQRAERKYGITKADYLRFWEVQGGSCAICGDALTHMLDDDEYKSAIDHCHETGAVRGLLCTACNCSIGLMRDIPERLEAAAEYLRRSVAH